MDAAALRQICVGRRTASKQRSTAFEVTIIVRGPNHRVILGFRAPNDDAAFKQYVVLQVRLHTVGAGTAVAVVWKDNDVHVALPDILAVDDGTRMPFQPREERFFETGETIEIRNIAIGLELNDDRVFGHSRSANGRHGRHRTFQQGKRLNNQTV